VLEVVAPISETIAERETSGCPRQLREMKLNRRCSILFHFEVPGGKWQSEIASPVSLASFCSSVFQSRVRLPFEPRSRR